MVNRNCKHCPIPGCGSKCLVRLANHFAQIHKLSELERRYWLKRLNPKPFFYKEERMQFSESVVIMDLRWKHPFPALVAGPTCCGKTQFVKCLLEAGEEMIDGAPVIMTCINQSIMKYRLLVINKLIITPFQAIFNLYWISR